MAAQNSLQTEPRDTVLLDRYRQNGDLQALEQLVERYRRPLFALIVRWGGVDGAEDAVQEIWLKVLKKPQAFREGRFAGWLFRVGRNLMIDRFRKKREINATDLVAEGQLSLIDTVPAREDDPGELLIKREQYQRLERVVGELPPLQREVFVMRTQSELRFREIAVAQKCSINTVLARMRYALDFVQRRMRQMEHEEQG